MRKFSVIKVYKVLALPIVLPGADKSLARTGRKQVRKYVQNARDFNNFDTRTVIMFCFPSRAKDLSEPLYIDMKFVPLEKRMKNDLRHSS